MVNVLRVNGEWLPTPEGKLSFKDTKIMTEKETEAGTTLANGICQAYGPRGSGR